MDEDLIAQIDSLAKKEGRSRSNMICKLLSLDKTKNKKA